MIKRRSLVVVDGAFIVKETRFAHIQGSKVTLIWALVKNCEGKTIGHSTGRTTAAAEVKKITKYIVLNKRIVPYHNKVHDSLGENMGPKHIPIRFNFLAISFFSFGDLW